MIESIDRSFFIFVDDLNECNRKSRIKFFKLLNVLLQKNSKFKIILFFRSEKKILKQFDETIRIDLISNVERDDVIVAHTVERRLFYLSKNVKSLVVKNLSRLAQKSVI